MVRAGDHETILSFLLCCCVLRRDSLGARLMLKPRRSLSAKVCAARCICRHISPKKRVSFKKRDLDTRLVTFSRSNDINALVSGDIQFDLTAPDKVIHSAIGGFPVKMIMGTARGLNLALVVHPSIRSAADMRGKSVAITGFSGLPYTGLLLSLEGTRH